HQRSDDVHASGTDIDEIAADFEAELRPRFQDQRLPGLDVYGRAIDGEGGTRLLVNLLRVDRGLAGRLDRKVLSDGEIVGAVDLRHAVALHTEVILALDRIVPVAGDDRISI